MEISIESLARSVAALDAILTPFADAPVDATRTGWLDELKSLADPLDSAGVREETQQLLGRLIDLYAQGDESDRDAVRTLLEQHRAFAWAAHFSDAPSSTAGLTKHLLKISADNGGQDIRDAIMAINQLCAQATQCGVDVAPIIDSVAALSSDKAKYGMGSMRGALLAARKRFAQFK